MEVAIFLALMLVMFMAIGLIFGILVIIGYLTRKSGASSTSASVQRPPLGPGIISPKRDSNIYHPSTIASRSSGTSIQFHTTTSIKSVPSDLEIKDLVDALTGAPLQLALGLYQCRHCKVFYQTHSFEVIQSENGGQCVSCLNRTIVSVIADREQRGRNADVSVVTLENYRQFTGNVITFEGFVPVVRTSRRGTDYAVMFENKAWTRGFKMVVFKGDAARLGGAWPRRDCALGEHTRYSCLDISHTGSP